MGSMALATSKLLLRIFTLFACVGCMVVFITNTFQDSLFNDGSKITFKDLKTYRFVFSTAVIGAACSVLQLPSALYHVCTAGKKMISNKGLREFESYGDEGIGLLLASGVGAGFAISFELKGLFNNLFDTFADAGVRDTEAGNSLYDNFLNRGIMATGLLLLGFVCISGFSVLSLLDRNKNG